MIETIIEIKHNIPIRNSLNSVNIPKSSNKRKVLIKNAFIHNFKTHRNGIAALKLKTNTLRFHSFLHENSKTRKEDGSLSIKYVVLKEQKASAISITRTKKI